ncbi:hypothetical protein PR202_gb03721 [Eleusine coracana subsp. coracana]|uniref:RING-type domain-containing protein n=1 Tax=Eleusine coracana subsp. coracana TaxID=191504 RepID=A0AAV5E1V9_ELECO|nr:hypothetical protein QOZ80_1BG0096810 [Eleusine coracana subsp. coracana]GJN16702.1 hypothetical protein PR202_gb03721 [Eleusine coracana subsp. coracana]
MLSPWPPFHRTRLFAKPFLRPSAPVPPSSFPNPTPIGDTKLAPPFAADMAAAAADFPTTLPIEKAAAPGGGDRAAADCGVCAICLDKIALQETALVKGCDHAYCVTCILRWASYKQTPLCPQCKHPFEFLSVHRSLDGCIHDYLFEESVCLLLRAAWFEPLIVEPREEALEEDEFYHQYQYDDDEDDLDEESYYMSRSPSIRIGNRRWGDNGYIRGGRREARPRPAQNESVDAGPSRTPKKKEATASGSGSGPVSTRTPKKKEASTSGSGSGSVSKDVAGRRAKRAQKREAADKAAAEKHLKHLQRLGLSKAPEVPATAEVGPEVNE